MKDEFAFVEAYKSPIPKRTKLLAKRPFLQAKRAIGPFLKTTLNWTGSVFPLLKNVSCDFFGGGGEENVS